MSLPIMWRSSVILLNELDDALSWTICASRSQSLSDVQLRKSLLPVSIEIMAEAFLPFIEEFVGVGLLHDLDVFIVPKSVG